MAEEKIIKATIDDGTEITLSKPVINKCKTVKEIIVDLENDEEAIPLPFSGKVMEKIEEYCEYHKDDPPAVQEKDDVDNTSSSGAKSLDLCEWDINYCDSFATAADLMKVLIAANHLNVKSLLDMLCWKVAQDLKGKTPEEMKKYMEDSGAISNENENEN